MRDTLEDLQNFGIDVANNNRRGVRTNFPFPETVEGVELRLWLRQFDHAAEAVVVMAASTPGVTLPS